jgi:hypothetical protein
MIFIAGFTLGVLSTIGFSLLTFASDDGYEENFDD